MPAGINENVFLKSVEAKKSPTGKDFLEITFENNEGQTAQMSEWKNEKSMWVKTDEDLQRRDNMQFLKVIYDKTNYTQVSKNGIFVEPMDKEKTEIKKFARDNFERQVVADVETSTDPLATTSTVDSTQVSGGDDLPF